LTRKPRGKFKTHYGQNGLFETGVKNIVPALNVHCYYVSTGSVCGVHLTEHSVQSDFDHLALKIAGSTHSRKIIQHLIRTL